MAEKSERKDKTIEAIGLSTKNVSVCKLVRVSMDFLPVAGESYQPIYKSG